MYLETMPYSTQMRTHSRKVINLRPKPNSQNCLLTKKYILIDIILLIVKT